MVFGAAMPCHTHAMTRTQAEDMLRQTMMEFKQGHPDGTFSAYLQKEW
jgi:hypothetical protein